MSEVKLPSAEEVTEATHISREKKVEKIIQGNVRTRKRPIGKRMMETFISEDANSE